MDRNRIISKLGKATIQADRQRTIYQVKNELGRGGNGVAFVVKSDKRELVAKFYVPPDTRDLDDSASKRFQREMDLTTQVDHPFVLASLGVGVARIGAYQIPFYLMARAPKTLRTIVPRTFYPGNLSALRIFLRVTQGASYLHHRRIVHRDLKPENILLFGDIPRISDLGIAHVAPDSATASLLTLPSDQLRNRDYYAPEQRSGDATKVDHRADIYALGCILYELISGISPTRPNLPPLQTFDNRLAPFDRIFGKMTAHEPRKRYQYVDEAIDDLIWAIAQIGDLAAPALATNEGDELLLTKLLNSANALHQAQAIEPARRLGEGALPILHDSLGHRRLDVATSSYKILGEFADASSLPFLMSGLYPRRTSSKLRFPTGEAAAVAIQKYDQDNKLKILDLINEVVRAEDIEILIRGMDRDLTYEPILRLYRAGKFFKDWGVNPGLSLLLRLDSEKAWPLIEELIGHGSDLYSGSVLRQVYPHVNAERKQRLIDYFLTRPSSLGSWEFNNFLDVLLNGELPEAYVSKTFDKLINASKRAFKRYDERRDFERHARSRKSQWEAERHQASAVTMPAGATSA